MSHTTGARGDALLATDRYHIEPATARASHLPLAADWVPPPVEARDLADGCLRIAAVWAAIAFWHIRLRPNLVGRRVYHGSSPYSTFRVRRPGNQLRWGSWCPVSGHCRPASPYHATLLASVRMPSPTWLVEVAYASPPAPGKAAMREMWAPYPAAPSPPSTFQG